MGIRFQCHHCGHQLNVKDFQAGKRGRCPACKGAFRIPQSDAEFSIAIAEGKDASVSVEQMDEELSGVTHSSTSFSTAATPSANALTSERALEIGEPSAQPGQLGDRTELAQVQPQVIVEAPDATWYVRPSSGGQYGPAPASIIWQWLIEDRIGHDSLVWRDDWPEWHSASQIFSDYFTAGQAVSNPMTGAMSVASQPVTASSQPKLEPEVPVAASTSTRELRKRSRRRKYTAAIAVLAVVLISLAIGLVVVLNQQGLLGGSSN